MKKLVFILGIIVVSELSSLAQSSYWHNWYFGNHAAISWCGVQPGNNPIPQMNSAMFAIEGSASISDNNCNLLFYSDGIRVWDSTHNVMPSSGTLDGCYSSGQGCLIVPLPGSTTLYYIFTTDCVENNYEKGLRYSMVDMNQNGGLGDVLPIVKNIALLDSANEALSAIYHQNNNDIWVLARQNNTHDYYAYLVGSAGIDTLNPVISTIGFNTDVFKIKFSRACPKLAVIGQGWPAAIELMKLDKSTGQLSDNIILAYTIRRGLEFSPNGKLLYFSSFTSLYQYDLSVYDSTSIVDSRILLDTNQNLACDLQLGPDNKIYEAQVNSNYLNRINNPNEIGTACNFVSDALLLGPTTGSANSSYFGLPNLITSGCHDDNESINLGGIAILCEGDSLLLDASDEWENYLWSSGDTTQTIWVTETGIYSVTAHSCCNNHIGSLEATVLQIPTVEFSSDTISSQLYVPLLLSPSITDGYTYSWSSGETSSEIEVLEAGTYTITVTGSSGCTAIASVVVIEDVSVSELLAESNIRIYPNPSNGSFTIDVGHQAIQYYELVITDINGKLIKKQVHSETKSLLRLNSESGVYLLKITVKENTFYKKIVLY
jgi:hypothetical protein